MITAFPSNATFLAFAKPFHSPSLNPQILAMISASPLHATHQILGPYAPNSAVAFPYTANAANHTKDVNSTLKYAFPQPG